MDSKRIYTNAYTRCAEIFRVHDRNLIDKKYSRMSSDMNRFASRPTMLYITKNDSVQLAQLLVAKHSKIKTESCTLSFVDKCIVMVRYSRFSKIAQPRDISFVYQYNQKGRESYKAADDTRTCIRS